MIFSLTFIQGICSKNTKQQNVSLQQVSIGCSYIAGETEGGLSNALNSVSDITGNVASGGALIGLGSIYISGSNPVGWGYWCGVGLCAL